MKLKPGSHCQKNGTLLISNIVYAILDTGFYSVVSKQNKHTQLPTIDVIVLTIDNNVGTEYN